MIAMEIMWEDTPQLYVEMEPLKITSKLLVEKPCLWIPKSIYPDKITHRSMEDFLCTRLPDKTREDMPEILRRYDLKYFNPYQMCMKSYGRNMSDYLWVRFSGQNVTFNDIRLR